MKCGDTDTGESRNFREFCAKIGIDLGQNGSASQQASDAGINPALISYLEDGNDPDLIERIGEFVDFKQVETRQFFGKQIGLISFEEQLLVKTKTMDQFGQYPCLCCFDTTELELLVVIGRVWQSKNPNVLFVYEGYGSISGSRDFIKTKDIPREPLPISDPKKVCFHGDIKENTGTVLFAGKASLVFLGNKDGEQILAEVGQARCIRKN